MDFVQLMLTIYHLPSIRGINESCNARSMTAFYIALLAVLHHELGLFASGMDAMRALNSGITHAVIACLLWERQQQFYICVLQGRCRVCH